MGAISRVLIAADLTHESDEAVYELGWLLRRLRPLVDVAHVWRPPASATAHPTRPERVRQLELATAAVRANGARVARTLLLEGDVEEELERLVARGRYDLVLVGPRAHGFRSVVSRMQRNAVCPVLAMPAPSGHTVPAGAHLRILAATDLSSCANYAAEQAVGIAEQLAASTTLLYVHSPLIPVAAHKLALPSSWALEEQLLEGELARLRHRIARPNIVIEHALLFGPVADSILTAAEGYDLVVLGTHGRSGWKSIWLGSIAERITDLARTPVITVREPAHHATSVTAAP